MLPDVAAGVGLAALAALSIAITSLAIRVGTDEGGTIDAFVVVLLCNVGLIVPIALVLAPAGSSLTIASAVAFVGAGIAGTLVGRLFYFHSIAAIGSSRTEPIKATQPLHATVIAVLVLGEHVSLAHFLGVVLVVVGVAGVSWEFSRDGSADGTSSLRALLPALAAALFFGVEPILAKFGLAGTDSMLLGLAVRIVAAAGGFFAYLVLRGALPAPDDFRTPDLWWYLGAGVANTSFLLTYYGALAVAPVSIVVPIVQTSPLVVMVLSMLFLPVRLERVTPQLVAAATVVVSGAIVVTLSS